MTKKCIGCGIVLQSNDKSKEGYVREDKINDSVYCENCFKLIHYGKVNSSNKDIDFKKIINDINKTKYPVLFVIDILNLNEENLEFFNMIKNKKYIILTKFDILPKGIKEGKIVKYFKDNFLNVDDIYCVSGINNYNVEKIFNILRDKKYKNVYLTGFTNAGKSTLLNSFLKLNGMKEVLTTSSSVNTTKENINININGINFIDTPGFKYNNSLYNELNEKEIIRIIPKKELKVKTFQVYNGDSIVIDNILRIDYKGDPNSLNFYMNNNLMYKRFKTKNKDYLNKYNFKEYEINGKKDIVISGLGFIKLNKSGNIKIYIKNTNLISIRNKMI